ncbi:efflux RND transporter periplasmic adaptor subunit [Treponema sp. HNW]|uniref:efflux RND transporter periplasmic adaptor subunit n=1 Tax=Treponema sp. HNW TaxID=3116654 RepID=UPI003D0F1F3A
MGRIKKIKLIVRAVLITAAAGGAFGIFNAQRKKVSYTPPSPPIKIIRPQKTTIEQSLTFSSYVEALSVIPVIPLVSGRIVEYPAKTGMEVHEGDILAQIDKEPFTQGMLQAKAAYESAENAYNRISALYKSNGVSLQDVETAGARRDSSKAAYELSLLQLNHADVRSPVSGTILKAPLAKGGTANPQQPAALIADLNTLIVRVHIPEKYVPVFAEKAETLSVYVERRLSTERPENAELSKPVRAKAVIDTISPYIQADTKTFEAVFKLNEHIELFKPGMFTEVHIVYGAYKDVPSLPLAVLKNDGSCYTYNPVKKNVTVRNFPVPVKDNLNFMVPEEFSQEWFVLSGSYRVFDGQSVEVIEENGLKKTEHL